MLARYAAILVLLLQLLQKVVTTTVVIIIAIAIATSGGMMVNIAVQCVAHLRGTTAHWTCTDKKGKKPFEKCVLIPQEVYWEIYSTPARQQ